VGKNENTHTAQQQFYNCIQKTSKGEKITIEDLVQAFDIEKVSKEFFDEYKKLYVKLVDELKRLYSSDEKINNDFNEHNINIDDFAKKTLGQLVFLYFIQKKGWLGVDKDKDWGSGDKKFLRNIFDKKYCDYTNFFNDILEHLFYEALASDRGISAWFSKLNCRIPFLNGGLFEPVNGYEWTKTDLTIDNNLFKEIFDTFDLYNFTVKEDEPLEKEVAIDPEMLGKVFENLLPENIRKGNGAFYTPREIVHYMCQESLINYLYNKLNIKEVELSPEEKAEQQSLFKKKKISQSKLTQEVIEEIISKEDIESFIKTGSSTYVNKQRNLNVTLPESIIHNATVLDKALSEIKVCDPAIGSGAFPVGMMNEIVRARAALSTYVGQPERSIYNLKRNAIENSIYGVDIDAGAVDIAKLRFWLSLVVDEEDVKNIKPLPNLDYKIMQGNSLISSYEGIDFDEIVDNQPESKQLGLFTSKSEKITEKISDKQKKFLETPYAPKKVEIKQEIEDLIVELVRTNFEEKAINECKPKDYYEEKIRNFAQNTENRNFFPWKLFFGDAFANGGFDVVIANPPYVGEKMHKELFEDIKTSALGKFYLGKMDLFYFFFHLALNILKNNGQCTFITTNYYITALGAKKLRTDFKERATLKQVINFNELKIFESALGQHNMITMLEKGKSFNSKCKVFNVNQKGYLDNNFNLIINGNHELTQYSTLEQEGLFEGSENYIRLSLENTNSLLNSILNKIKSNNKLLGQICNINQGVVSGCDYVNKESIKKLTNTDIELNDGIFVLNMENLRDKVIYGKIVSDDSTLLKPFYKNSDIQKYYSSSVPKKYLIYTDRKTKNIDNYKEIKIHLSKFKEILQDRREVKNGVINYFQLQWARKKEIFEGAKIVVPYRSITNTFGYNENIWFCRSDSYVITSDDNNYNLKYLLGILNSKLYYIWLYHKGKRKGETLELFQIPLSEIPILKAKKDEQINIANIVDKILDITNSENYLNSEIKLSAVKDYEKQIDVMIYKLYDLTYQEVKTIDSEFLLSEEEYNKYV
jgi:adenine-specific DNA-methyltransferase